MPCPRGCLFVTQGNARKLAGCTHDRAFVSVRVTTTLESVRKYAIYSDIIEVFRWND